MTRPPVASTLSKRRKVDKDSDESDDDDNIAFFTLEKVHHVPFLLIDFENHYVKFYYPYYIVAFRDRKGGNKLGAEN